MSLANPPEISHTKMVSAEHLSYNGTKIVTKKQLYSMVIFEYSNEEIIKISALKLTLWEKIKLKVTYINS